MKQCCTTQLRLNTISSPVHAKNHSHITHSTSIASGANPTLQLFEGYSCSTASANMNCSALVTGATCFSGLSVAPRSRGTDRPHKASARINKAAGLKVAAAPCKSLGPRPFAGRRSVRCLAQTAPAPSSTCEDLKSQLKTELEGAQSRPIINELLLQLEAKNPTPAPTDSPLLTGSWKFAYNGSIAPGLVPSPTRPLALAMYAGGFSPGNFGLAIASMLPDDIVKTEDFTLAISGMSPYLSTAAIRVKALGRQFSIKVKCELVAESTVRLRETYKSVEVYGRPSEVPASLQYERLMFVSYLDDDLMVARDETGTVDIMFRLTEEESEELTEKEKDTSTFGDDPLTSAAQSVEGIVSDAADAASGVISQLEDAEKAVESEIDDVVSDLTEAVTGVSDKVSSELTAAQEAAKEEVEEVAETVSEKAPEEPVAEESAESKTEEADDEEPPTKKKGKKSKK